MTNQTDENLSFGATDRPPPTLSELGLSAICLSASDAAVYLGLAPQHDRRIQYLGQQGRLPRLAVGRTCVYPVSGLTEFAQGNTKFRSPSRVSTSLTSH